VGDWRYASSLTHLTSSPSNTNSLDSIFSIDFYKLSFY
jgi:hypothetical protein